MADYHQSKDIENETERLRLINLTGNFASKSEYDLWFGSDRVTGSFTAPWCELCCDRPSRMSCLKS